MYANTNSVMQVPENLIYLFLYWRWLKCLNSTLRDKILTLYKNMAESLEPEQLNEKTLLCAFRISAIKLYLKKMWIIIRLSGGAVLPLYDTFMMVKSNIF